MSEAGVKIASSRRGIILDKIKPADFTNLKLIYCCEQCSHFDPENTVCTIGYDPSNHTQAHQLALYERTGRMAFCRFLEID